MFVFPFRGNNYCSRKALALFKFKRRPNMDYLKHAKRKTLGREELIFIRCDKNGNVIPEETLNSMSITNSTIERIVTDVAGRISADGTDGGNYFSEGIITS